MTKRMEEVERIKGNIRSAMNLRKPLEDEWNEFLNVYHVVPRKVVPDNITAYHSHRGHQNLARMVSRLTYRDPKWNVLAANQFDPSKDMSYILRHYLSWFMYHHDVREDTLEDVVLDMLIAGTGLIGIGYKEREERKPGKKTDLEEAELQLDLAATAMEANIQDLDILAQAADDVVQEIAPPPPEDIKERINPGEPYVYHADIWDTYLSPGYPSVEKAFVGGGWIVKRIVMPFDMANSEKRYSNRDLIKPTRQIETPQWAFLGNGVGSRRDGQQTMDYAELWEYWEAPDRNNDKPGKVWVISMDSPKEHWVGDNPYPELNSFPFREVRFKRKKGEFYGIPYLKHQMENIDNYDSMRSFHQDIARFKKPIIAGQKGVHTQAMMDAITQSPSGHALLVEAPEQIKSLEFGDASPELASEINLLDRDTTTSSGLGPPQAQAFGSATEASIAQSNLDVDTQFVGHKLNTVLGKVGRDVVILLQTRSDPEEIIRIAGTDGREWVEFNRDDIQGEFDIRVGAGTALPIDEAVRQKALIDLFAIAQSNPGQFRLNELARDIFEMAGLPSPDRYVINTDARDQGAETLGMLLSGQLISVQPGDEHARHRADIGRHRQAIQMLSQQGQVSEELLDNLQQLDQNLGIHDQQHAEQMGEAALPTRGGVTRGSVMAAARGG